VHDKSKIDSLMDRYRLASTIEIGEMPNLKVVFLPADTVEITGSLYIKNDTLKEKRRVISMPDFFI